MGEQKIEKPRCKHLRVDTPVVPYGGGPTVLRHECELLESLAKHDRAGQLAAVEKMAEVTGDSSVVTKCLFEGLPSCPYYTP